MLRGLIDQGSTGQAPDSQGPARQVPGRRGAIWRWCFQHALLLFAGLFLIAFIVQMLNFWRDPQPSFGFAAMVYYGTLEVFFFVPRLLEAIGLAPDGLAFKVVQVAIIIGLLVAADLAIDRLRQRSRAVGKPNWLSRVFLDLPWLLLRHLILVWGIVAFFSGLAVVLLDPQYDAGGMETFVVFAFLYFGQPVLVAQWLLQAVGVDFSQHAWPYASLVLGLLLWWAADFVVHRLYRRPQATGKQVDA
jgi:hypothetical protein